MITHIISVVDTMPLSCTWIVRLDCLCVRSCSHWGLKTCVYREPFNYECDLLILQCTCTSIRLWFVEKFLRGNSES